jgi:hypothetical protein
MTDYVHIVKAEGYIHITFSGQFSPEAAKRCVDEMVAACTREKCAKVLFDCRPMAGDMSVMNRFDIAQYGAVTIPSSLKIAMLGRRDQLLPDNFFENVARNRGVTVTVFSEIDKAIRWLKE